MALSRYSFAGRRFNDQGQGYISTTKTNARIRRAVLAGEISVSAHTLEQGERLDTLAFLAYNDSSYWWVIAAASGIGWNLQVPPGTLVQIPISLESAMGYVK